jgi:hypothetical protein
VTNRAFGLRVLICGQLFGLLETWYFGWNFLPQSPAEIICDGMALMITIYGLSFCFRNNTEVRHGSK